MTAHPLKAPDQLVAVTEEVARALGQGRGFDLPAAVREVSDIYTRGRDALELASEREALWARLRFFLPRDLPKVMAPLMELGDAGLLPDGPSWRVLDVGAGLGTTSLGVAAFAAETGAARSLEVVAVDRDGAALQAYRQLAKRSTDAGMAAVRLETHVGDVEVALGQGAGFDLIVSGLTLNELGDDDDPGALDARAMLLRRLTHELAPGGALIVVEPALRAVTRALMGVRDRLAAREGAPYVFGPCPHRGACPMLPRKRDWCHEDRRFVLPEPLIGVAREAGLRFERSTFAYLTLRNTPDTLADQGLVRAVSAPMVSKGKRELLACGADGLAHLMRLERHASEANEAFEALRRGDLFGTEGLVPKGSRLRVEGSTRVRLKVAR